MNPKRQQASIDIAENYRNGMFATPKTLEECISALRLYWPGIKSEDRMHALTAMHMVMNGVAHQLAPAGSEPEEVLILAEEEGDEWDDIELTGRDLAEHLDKLELEGRR